MIQLNHQRATVDDLADATIDEIAAMIFEPSWFLFCSGVFCSPVFGVY
jgi:hypothetical protein